MATKKKAIDAPAEPAKEAAPEGVLVKAAKTIGEVAGKIAMAVGVAPPAKPKTPKLVKKNKPRLPRRQKKIVAKKVTQQG
jgi:hypothetical protein